jgi:hypothetical protein
LVEELENLRVNAASDVDQPSILKTNVSLTVLSA